ncbi:laccase [Halenospora varia]|nr:laccase [Halenospora varia]
MLFSKYGLLLAFSLGASAAVAPRAKQATTSSKTSSSVSSTKTSSSVSSLSASLISLKAPSTSASGTSSAVPSSTSLVADSACSNTPFTRQCWGGGFSIATDYDTSWPVTGKTVSYNLEITNTTMAPDGFERIVFAINGQYPGPTIHANWGDTISVTVKNSLQNNGTGIHWHGIRQMNSGQMDGTSGVTECPIPPGASRTYTWLATQFGTSWYHSHYSSQYGDGVVGPIVINGPATANYDYDLGAMTINDWYYQTAFQVNHNSQTAHAPPTADNALINGTMTSSHGGSYNKVTLQKGKKYRLRLINTSLDNHFRVSLDNHNLTVVQADFVPTKPYVAETIFIAIGQRYDVIINANQDVDNYWFRAQVMTDCGGNANNGNIKSIFSYSGAANADPTSTSYTIPNNCNDETGLTPYVVKNVPSTNFATQYEALDILFDLGPSAASNGQNVVRWNVNGSMIDIDWEKPTLQYVESGNSSYPTELNLITLPKANELHFWVIQSVTGITFTPHPIHLHGHDFYLMGSGTGTFSDPSVLNYNNPPRRDVSILPSGGWLVLAFSTDNPGAWLMHCHIAWHVSQGLAVQFLERASEIPSTFSLNSIESECSAWDSWYATSPYKKDDSGL